MNGVSTMSDKHNGVVRGAALAMFRGPSVRGSRINFCRERFRTAMGLLGA